MFRTNELNASLRDIFPDYCYLAGAANATAGAAEAEGEVFFNAPRQGMGTPTSPVGTPICNVTTTTLWNGKLPFQEVGPFEANEAVYNYGTNSADTGSGTSSANANGENAAINAANDGSE